MSLDIPTLDDRPYETILRDARNRIPVYSETWTDHNASDPGITVLELLAWLAETYTYQLDRITDAHRLKYLALLGERPRPPRPATAAVRVTLPDHAGSAAVNEGAKLLATTGDDRTVGFETTVATAVTRATLERVVVDGARGRRDQTTANRTAGMQFTAFGDGAEGVLYLGFAGNPFGGEGELALSVKLAEDDLPALARHGAGVDAWTEDATFEPTVAVEWEHCPTYEWYDEGAWESLPVEADGTNQFYESGRVVLKKPDSWNVDGGTMFDHATSYRWIRCRVTTPGHEIVPRIDSVAVNVLPVERRWTVRSEGGEPLRDGQGNTASTGLPDQRFEFEHGPLLDTDVAVWVGDERWRRRDDFDAAGPYSRCFVVEPSYRGIRFGDGARGTIPPLDAPITATRYVGTGDAGSVSAEAEWSFAGADVRFRDPKGKFTTADPASLTVEQVADVTGGAPAEPIEDAFDRLVADRRVPYRAVTAPDYEYLATHTPGLRFGRAAVWVVQDDPVERPPSVWSKDAADVCRGDGDSDRRPDEDRVVSADDGRPVRQFDDERMRQRPKTKQRSAAASRQASELSTESSEPASSASAAGDANADGEAEPSDESPRECEPHRSVNVVVVPYSRSSRPEPSTGFLDAVDAHLDRHRLLTDRVRVEPPTYVGVGVDVEVRLESEYAVTDRRDAIDAALDEFLDPLRGFEGDGWPFGRPLYRSELYEEIESVPGVDCVTRLDVRTDGRLDANGAVVVDADALLTPTDHTVTARVGTNGPAAGDCDRP
ncbi:baseplate J/gp47 family protein [Halogeometricum sp. CBA1124]|uniref:baseplate J/gp47 family protein n=1 Tax=Halogeometricum sp. CBA1124 TaxID=2668071 RepID=UPI00142B08B5|nr:hypothetical protein [Halogeometricum sp. CBA1124]